MSKRKLKHTKLPFEATNTDKKQVNFYKSYFPPERDFNAPLFDRNAAVTD